MFLKIVLKESPIYINAIVVEVTASYSKFNASLGYDLILAIVIPKCGQICKKKNVYNIFCLLLLVIAKNLL